MNSGVYEILNTLTGDSYIGSTSSFSTRWSKHRRSLIGGVHHSRYLQRAWDKYGHDAFSFRKLIVCSPVKDQLLLYEQLCLDTLAPKYNSIKIAGSPRGFKHPPEFGAAISARQKGKIYPPEFGAAISARRKGKPLTTTHKTNLSLSHKGKRLTKEHREKIGKAAIGRVQSAIWCDNMAKVRIGVPHPTRVQRNIFHDGETLCALEWSRKLGIKYSTILARIHRGWPPECILSAPLQQGVHPNRRKK